jgi:hypothetical protein
MAISAKTRWTGLVLIGLLIAALAAWEAWRRSPIVAPPAMPVPAKTVEAPAPVKKEIPPPPVKKVKPKPVAPAVVRNQNIPIPKPQIPPPAVNVPVSLPVTPTPIPSLPVPVAAPPEAREWQGTDTSVTHNGQIVIHNDRQWIHFWSEHHPHEAAPDVDFTHDMVIGVFAGSRPAEPFSIRILEVRTLPGTLVADYRERLPPPGTFAVNVTVYPYDIKVIPRSDLPVKFNLLQPENPIR